MKSTAAICVALVLSLVSSAYALEKPATPATTPEPQADAIEPEKGPVTAWGKEVGGLQAGLGFKAGEKRAYRHGETANIVLRVRNVGKEEVEFKHIWAFFVENPPSITDADGKPVQLPKYEAQGEHGPRSPKVAPGKEVDLYEWKLDLRPSAPRLGRNIEFSTLYGTGKFSVQCERIVGRTSSNSQDPNPAFKDLATGKLELEVKEDLTAWGQEVGGLQAGLGFKAGEKRSYRHGETAALVVRVRNVGQHDIKFKYYPTFLSENLPTVLDETGKRVSLRGNLLRLVHRDVPKEVNLAVGKEIELYERELRLAKGNEDAGELKTRDIFPTGKFLIQHEQVIGNTAQGFDKLDPALEKLATGKLELEVKEDLTAWGKEVGGLQAGLGFKAGEQRAYRHGETVPLVVRVRNVGDKDVKFEYLRQYFNENPPVVTNAAGTKIPLKSSLVEGRRHEAVEVTLGPGKDIALTGSHPFYELKLELDPSFGTGKVQVQYDPVFGNSSIGQIKLDPVLSTLATGKLELEIMPIKRDQ